MQQRSHKQLADRQGSAYCRNEAVSAANTFQACALESWDTTALEGHGGEDVVARRVAPTDHSGSYGSHDSSGFPAPKSAHPVRG